MLFVLRWWMLASTLGFCVGYAYKIAKRPGQNYPYKTVTKRYQWQPSQYQAQPLEYNWQPTEYQEQQYDYQTYGHNPYDYQSYAYQSYDYQPPDYQSFDSQPHNYQYYDYQSYNHQPYEYQHPEYYQPYDYHSHYYEPYVYQQYAYQTPEYQPSYPSNYYYYYPHHEPSVPQSYDPKPEEPHTVTKQLLAVYELIRVIAVFRDPIHKPVTSLDRLVRELTDEGLQRKLVEVLRPVNGYEKGEEAVKKVSLVVKKSFVNDDRQLLVEIQQVLNGFKSGCGDDLCKQLRRLRDRAKALTVEQIEAEMKRGIKADAKKPLVSIVVKNHPSKVEPKDLDVLRENYEVVGLKLLDKGKPLGLDKAGGYLLMVDKPKGEAQESNQPSKMESKDLDDLRENYEVVGLELLEKGKPESKEQQDINKQDIVDLYNILTGQSGLDLDGLEIQQGNFDKQDNSIEEVVDTTTTAYPVIPIHEVAKLPLWKIQNPKPVKDTVHPQEIAVKELFGPDAIVPSTTLTPTTTEDKPAGSLGSLIGPGHYGDSNGVPESQKLPQPIDVSQPTVLIEPEVTATTNPNNQNAWVPEEPTGKDPLDFAIDQRFKIPTTTTFPVPLRVADSSKDQEVESKHEVEPIGDEASTPKPHSINEQQELQPLDTTTEAPTTAEPTVDQLTTLNIHEARTESAPAGSKNQAIFLTEYQMSQYNAWSKITAKLWHIFVLMETEAGFPELRAYISRKDAADLAYELSFTEGDLRWSDLLKGLQRLIESKEMANGPWMVELLEFWKYGFEGHVNDDYFERIYGDERLDESHDYAKEMKKLIERIANPFPSIRKPDSTDVQEEHQPLDTTTEASTTPAPIVTSAPDNSRDRGIFLTHSALSQRDAVRKIREKVGYIFTLLQQPTMFPELVVYHTDRDVHDIAYELSFAQGDLRWSEMFRSIQRFIEGKEMINGDRIVDVLEFWKQAFEGRVNDGYFERVYGQNKSVGNQQISAESYEFGKQLALLHVQAIEGRDLGSDPGSIDEQQEVESLDTTTEGSTTTVDQLTTLNIQEASTETAPFKPRQRAIFLTQSDMSRPDTRRVVWQTIWFLFTLLEESGEFPELRANITEGEVIELTEELTQVPRDFRWSELLSGVQRLIETKDMINGNRLVERLEVWKQAFERRMNDKGFEWTNGQNPQIAERNDDFGSLLAQWHAEIMESRDLEGDDYAEAWKSLNKKIATPKPDSIEEQPERQALDVTTESSTTPVDQLTTLNSLEVRTETAPVESRERAIFLTESDMSRPDVRRMVPSTIWYIFTLLEESAEFPELRAANITNEEVMELAEQLTRAQRDIRWSDLFGGVQRLIQTKEMINSDGLVERLEVWKQAFERRVNNRKFEWNNEQNTSAENRQIAEENGEFGLQLAQWHSKLMESRDLEGDDYAETWTRLNSKIANQFASTPKSDSIDEQQEVQPLDATTVASATPVDQLTTLNIQEVRTETAPVESRERAIFLTQSDMSRPYTRRIVWQTVWYLFTLLEESAGFPELRANITKEDVIGLTEELTQVPRDLRWSELLSAVQRLIETKEMIDGDRIKERLESLKVAFERRVNDGDFERTNGLNTSAENRQIPKENDAFALQLDQWHTEIMDSRDLVGDDYAEAWKSWNKKMASQFGFTQKPDSFDEQTELRPLETTTTVDQLTTQNILEQRTETAPVLTRARPIFLTESDMSRPDARRIVWLSIWFLFDVLEELEGFLGLRDHFTNEEVIELAEELALVQGDLRWSVLFSGVQRLIKTKETINGDRLVDRLEMLKQYFEGYESDDYFERTYGLKKSSEIRQMPEENDEFGLRLLLWLAKIVESKDLEGEDYAEANESAIESSKLPVEARNPRIYKIDDSTKQPSVINESSVPLNAQAEEVTDQPPVTTPQSFPANAT